MSAEWVAIGAPAMAGGIMLIAAALPQLGKAISYSLSLLLVGVFVFAVPTSGQTPWLFWSIAAGLFFLYGFLARGWSESAWIAGLLLAFACAFRSHFLDSEFREFAVSSPVPLSLVAAVLAAIFALTPTAIRWRQRRRVWLTDPERLLEPGPRAEFADGTCVALGVAVLMLGLLLPSQWNVVAGIVAALAVGGSAHRARWPIADVLAVGIGAAAWYFLSRDWFGATHWSNIVGVALAAAFCFWIARFWHQQLRDGIAWTTSGRLIVPARACGTLLCFLLPAFVFGPFLNMNTLAIPTLSWGSVMFGLTCVALLVLLQHEMRSQQGSVAVWCSGLVAIALSLPLATVFARWFPAVPLAAALAGATLVFALFLPRDVRDGAAPTVANALTYVVLPILLVLAILTAAGATGSRLVFVVCGVLILTAFGVRSTRMKPAAVAA